LAEIGAGILHAFDVVQGADSADAHDGDVWKSIADIANHVGRSASQGFAAQASDFVDSGLEAFASCRGVGGDDAIDAMADADIKSFIKRFIRQVTGELDEERKDFFLMMLLSPNGAFAQGLEDSGETWFILKFAKIFRIR